MVFACDFCCDFVIFVCGSFVISRNEKKISVWICINVASTLNSNIEYFARNGLIQEDDSQSLQKHLSKVTESDMEDTKQNM